MCGLLFPGHGLKFPFFSNKLFRYASALNQKCCTITLSLKYMGLLHPYTLFTNNPHQSTVWFQLDSSNWSLFAQKYIFADSDSLNTAGQNIPSFLAHHFASNLKDTHWHGKSLDASRNKQQCGVWKVAWMANQLKTECWAVLPLSHYKCLFQMLSKGSCDFLQSIVCQCTIAEQSFNKCNKSVLLQYSPGKV